MKKIFRLTLLIGLALALQLGGASAKTIEDPEVAGPVPAQNPVTAGLQTEWSVQAGSPVGLPVTYVWSCVSGNIRGEGARAYYTAPAVVPIAGFDTITVVVRDSEGRTAAKSATIDITSQVVLDEETVEKVEETLTPTAPEVTYEYEYVYVDTPSETPKSGPGLWVALGSATAGALIFKLRS